MVERVLGKDEVTGSIPVNGSISRRTKLVAASLAIGCFFLALTYRGIFAYFSGDDVMNIQFLHGYGRVPFGVVLAQAIATFTPEYRPVGGVYYRALYALFGFHPLPFRIAFFALLLLNLFLVGYCLKLLTRSNAVALFAVLVVSFHPAMSELYFNDGTVYDVLCLLFFVLAFAAYLRVRQTGRYLEPRHLLQIALLFAGALGSKEMAITFPAILLLYEIVFWPKLKDILVRLRPILITAAMAVLFISMKVFVPNQMSINELYSPFRPVSEIVANYLYYHRLLFFSPALSGVALVAILLLALSFAAALRSRPMLFGLCFTLITLVPVCVIAPRAGFVWYLPLIGYALYLGAVLTRVSLLKPSLLQPALLGALMALLFALWFPFSRDDERVYATEQNQLRTLVQAALSAAPMLPQRSRLLLIRDPFTDQSRWLALFASRLAYHDATLWVDRASQLGPAYDPNDISLYTLTLDWDGTKYLPRFQPQPNGTPLRIRVFPDAAHRAQDAQIELEMNSEPCPLDVAYRMPQDELQRAGVWSHWTDLTSGLHVARGAIHIDQDAERGRVVIDRLRLCHGPWMPATGSFLIIP